MSSLNTMLLVSDASSRRYGTCKYPSLQFILAEFMSTTRSKNDGIDPLSGPSTQPELLMTALALSRRDIRNVGFRLLRVKRTWSRNVA